MLKMFSTQLSGLFKRLQDKEELGFEDAARLLAQAPAGDGSIFVYGTKEMKAIIFEATEGAEPLRSAVPLDDSVMMDGLDDADRVLIVSRFAHDSEAVELALRLQDKGISFVGISTVTEESGSDSMANLADVHIDLGMKKPLLPAEDGSRFGYPSSIAALYVYYAIKFTIDEILEEYELN